MSHRTVTVPTSIPFPARQLGSVLQNLLGIPVSQVQWLLSNGCVAVNSRPRRKSHERLEPGDIIDVELLPMPTTTTRSKKNKSSPSSTIEFLYDDDSLCVVTKPAGILTVPTKYGERNTLVARVERKLQQSDRNAKVFCVHRLDRDVSGVLVLAKNMEMAEAIRNQFADRKPDRQYIAIVAGEPQPHQSTIRSYLATDADLNRFSVSNPEQGELAITHYQVRKVWNDSAMVEVRLETGRRNQIRVHLAEKGHPILGETRYRIQQAKHWAWPHHRLALHAETLGFSHPVTKEPIEIKSQWPQEFRDFLRMIEKRQ